MNSLCAVPAAAVAFAVASRVGGVGARLYFLAAAAARSAPVGVPGRAVPVAAAVAAADAPVAAAVRRRSVHLLLFSVPFQRAAAAMK